MEDRIKKTSMRDEVVEDQEYSTSQRGADLVAARLVQTQRQAVEQDHAHTPPPVRCRPLVSLDRQDHAHAHSLEPRAPCQSRIYRRSNAVVKLLDKKWRITTGTRPEEPKLEPEGPRAEVVFPKGFRAVKVLCLPFMAFK